MMKLAAVFLLCYLLSASAVNVCVPIDDGLNELLAEYRELDPTFMCSVGMKDGRVADEDITASSQWDGNHAPQFARIYNQKSFSHPSYMAAWAGRRASTGDWIQVNLRKPTTVTGVITQGRGRNDAQQWVTGYKVSYSNDGHNFLFVQDAAFVGNHDRSSVKINKFDEPVTAQYFRLIVTSIHSHPTLRMDLLTC